MTPPLVIGKEEIEAEFESFIAAKYNVSSSEVERLVSQKEIPVSVFNSLSVLEGVCKYLHENLELSFSEIATLLERDQRVIWRSYQNALSKKSGKLSVDSSLSIPISVFRNSLGCLESVVVYLKERRRRNFSEISRLLNRDSSTIWTTYKRAKAKRGKK